MKQMVALNCINGDFGTDTLSVGDSIIKGGVSKIIFRLQ